MFKNYLLTSFRSLKKERFYVTINLLSLAMAFALCTIGFFNFMYNHTYNHSFEGYDTIYKVNATPSAATLSKEVGISPIALRESMISQFPDLKIARFHSGALKLKVRDRLFSEPVGYVDTSFLDILHFQNAPLHLGLDQLIITEDLAVRLFGKKDAKGELLEVLFSEGDSRPLIVGEVIPVPNQNTSFKFAVLLHIDHYINSEQLDRNSWNAWVGGTFLQLEDENVETTEAALQSYLPIQNVANPELELKSYRLDKIADWAHFEKRLHGRCFGGVLHPASVIGTMSSAFAILLLACFNFFNTTIATSGKRLKEISMRKVIGGRRKDIIIQFMTESGLQVICAFLLSLIIAYMLIGPYNAMFRYELVQFQPAYLRPYVCFAFGICALTILLSGAYPAFYISRFRSLDILKNKTKFKGNGLLTKSLLAIQFAVCSYNIFALGVFFENANYQESLDRGYDVKKFINVPVQPRSFNQLKHEIKQASGFDLVMGTKDLVGFSDKEISVEYDGVEYASGKLVVGEGYLSGLGVEFQEGQDFFSDRASNEHLILVNETFNRHMGGGMLGKQVVVREKKYRIHGITADFNLKTIMLSNKIKPTVFFFAPDSIYNYAVIKCEESRLVAENERLEKIWYRLFPEQLYEGFYQEKVFDNVNTTNQIMVRINSFIAIVSILISILGLYALISLTVQRRIKEIGIRKTLGASFAHVLKLLLTEVSWMLMVSTVLGLIAGAYVINMLLDIIYAYHIEIDILNYTFSILVVLISAIVSIGYKVVVTARMNPVTQLRTE